MPRRRCTVRTQTAFERKVCVERDDIDGEVSLSISQRIKEGPVDEIRHIFLSPKKARKLFTEGLLMCDEIEGK